MVENIKIFPEINIEDLGMLINESLITGIIGINHKGKIIYWNKSASLIFGWEEKDVINKNISALFFKENNLQKAIPGISAFFNSEWNSFFEKTITTAAWHANGNQIKTEMIFRKMNKEGQDLVFIFVRDITIQKNENAELEKSFERLSMISKTTNDAIWEWDMKTGKLWCNENHQLLYGLNLTDPVPSDKEWASRIHPDDRERIIKLQNDAFASDTNVFISEYKFRGKGNKYINVFDRCYILRDAEGKPVKTTGSMMNITESKKAEEMINSSNKRFEFIAKTTNDAVWELDLITNEVFANERYQILYGLTLNDPAPSQDQWIEHVHPDDKERIVKSFLKAVDSKENIWIEEYRFIDSKGIENYILDRTYILRDQNKKAIRFIGSMMIVTDQRKAEMAIRYSEEKYKTLVEQATDGIFIANKTGNFEIVNSAGLLLSQYTLEELKKMTIYDLTDPDDLKKNPFHFHEMKSEKGSRVERKLKRKDGSLIDIEVNAKFLSNGNFLAFIRDISTRKKAEAELIESNKSIRKLTTYLQNAREDERTNIAREIHDELGQSLTVLKMDFSWINKKVSHFADDSVKQRFADVLNMLNDTVNTVRRISTDLRPSLLDDLGLAAAIEWQLNEFEKRSGIYMHYELVDKQIASPISKPVATAFFRILQESLTNIARHSDATKAEVTLKRTDKYLELLINDNGVGFDTVTIDKRTLGILGMKERAKIVGGLYKIKSVIGEGTKIIVRVPGHLV